MANWLLARIKKASEYYDSWDERTKNIFKLNTNSKCDSKEDE